VIRRAGERVRLQRRKEGHVFKKLFEFLTLKWLWDRR